MRRNLVAIAASFAAIMAVIAGVTSLPATATDEMPGNVMIASITISRETVLVSRHSRTPETITFTITHDPGVKLSPYARFVHSACASVNLCRQFKDVDADPDSTGYHVVSPTKTKIIWHWDRVNYCPGERPGLWRLGNVSGNVLLPRDDTWTWVDAWPFPKTTFHFRYASRTTITSAPSSAHPGTNFTLKGAHQALTRKCLHPSGNHPWRMRSTRA